MSRLFAFLLLLAPASAAESPAATETPADAGPPANEHPAAGNEESSPAPASDLVSTEIASLLRLGERKREAGDYEFAIIAFQQAGKAAVDVRDREAALLGLGRAYRQSGELVKAVAAYERLVHDHGDSTATPRHLLELGRTLRAVGSNKLAIARFYSVLHMTLKVPQGQAEAYRQVARTAQFEIAETHYLMGNYAEAARYFTRLNLLDLAPSDRLQAEFKAAQALARAGDVPGALNAFRTFLERNAESAFAAEARFQLALLLRQSGRGAESLEVTLELLRRQQTVAGQDEAAWSDWQRRTGNELANAFYQQGDYQHALTIYRCLADLIAQPRWRVPVIYQMALCQERLLQYGTARELYQAIRTEIAAQAPGDPELEEFRRMAAWRLTQLEWTAETARSLEALKLPPNVPNTAASANQT